MKNKKYKGKKMKIQNKIKTIKNDSQSLKKK